MRATLAGGGRLITFAHGSWSAPAQTADSFLGSIDCAAPARCVTVGRGGTLILTGQSWHHVVGPGRHLHLTGIDCVDPAFCVARWIRGFAELHAGVWAQLPGPNVIAGPSCASRTLCVGDGFASRGTVDQTFNGWAHRQSKHLREKTVSCAEGPMCIELTNDSALVGHA